MSDPILTPDLENPAVTAGGGDDILERHPQLRGNPRAMVMMTAYLRDRGLHDDAMAMAMAATAAAPDDMAVRHDLRDILSPGIATFHASMLNDHPRNGAYIRAIERMVKPGMKVLEIGAGSGLLAMAAARAGATVVTCEGHPMIAAAANAIVRLNGYQDRVRVIPKLSSDVRIPDDMPEPADLVIHEIFGKLLFDEGVTPAMTDARARLLKPGARSVPPHAELRCVLVRSERRWSPEDAGIVEGFDLSPFNMLTMSSKRDFFGGKKGMTICSEPVAALRMDYDAPAPFGPAAETVELISTGGRVDGVVQWLRIDFDEETLENDPFTDGPPSSWAANFFPFPAPIETRPGDSLPVVFRHRGERLSVGLDRQTGSA